MKKRVLFVDNDPDFLDTRSEQLERAGFDVFKAISFEKAEQILHDHWVHLAIIDLRLRDDSDDRDTSGLTLAKQEDYYLIPKIILTRFPRYEHVREALGPALEGLPPAVDYLDKQEGPEVMMQAVERVLTEFVRINWDLTIRHRGQISFFHLADLIEPGLESTQIPDRVAELEDLFRCLFYDSSQITIDQLFTQGEKGVVLVVFAFSEEGIESQFVVACGQRQQIQTEENHYEVFVPKAIGWGGTAKTKSTETVHFAAIAYALTNGDLDEMTTFSEFYRSSSGKTVKVALDHLFNTTLKPWYKKGRFQEEKKTLNEFFLEWLGLREEALLLAELEPRLEAICRETLTTGLAGLDYSTHKLTLHLPDGSPIFYPNPISCLSETRIVSASSILCGTTHGRLNGNSILTDQQGQTWLIDFSRVSRGPLVRDFVSLEAAIKFDLLTTSNILARYEMERRLLAVSRLDEAADAAGLESELQKALQAITCVRQQALAVISYDMNPYLGGLLFCAIAQLTSYTPQVRHTRRELVLYLHSLLSAAMLCQKLIPSPRQDLPVEALNTLWIDEPNKQVWVEGRQAQLTSQEFDLLAYLYRHRGQLCSRADIAEHVFGTEYKPQDMSTREKNRLEETRLNSTMSRLRRKIEPNPDNPKYIIAIRGEGYKLELTSFPP